MQLQGSEVSISWKKREYGQMLVPCTTVDNTETGKLCFATFIFTRGGNLKDPNSLSKTCGQKLLLEESFLLLEVMLECRLAYQLTSREIHSLLEEYIILEDVLLCSSAFWSSTEQLPVYSRSQPIFLPSLYITEMLSTKTCFVTEELR